jgi:excisionase family DNA binding protein
MRPPPPDLRVLTTADVARLLGISPRTVRRWAADGTLPPPVRKGCRYTRWRLADVQRFLGEHRTLPDAPPLTPELRDLVVLLARKLTEDAANGRRQPAGEAPAG